MIWFQKKDIGVLPRLAILSRMNYPSKPEGHWEKIQSQKKITAAFAATFQKCNFPR